jgi:hypothetical protein
MWEQGAYPIRARFRNFLGEILAKSRSAPVQTAYPSGAITGATVKTKSMRLIEGYLLY